jgi:NAD(P)-dependent dehydrogenase (short-subunit alcohol dehydrogenase family)
MSKVWFITGSSRGLGRNFVEAALCLATCTLIHRLSGCRGLATLGGPYILELEWIDASARTVRASDPDNIGSGSTRRRASN